MHYGPGSQALGVIGGNPDALMSLKALLAVDGDRLVRRLSMGAGPRSVS